MPSDYLKYFSEETSQCLKKWQTWGPCFCFSYLVLFFCSSEPLPSDQIMQKLWKETLVSGAMGFAKWGSENQLKSETW